MWWSEMRLGVSRLVRLAAPLAAAGLLAGCFQPLYGERSIGGRPSIKAAFASVDLSQIPAPRGSPESRNAGDVPNNLFVSLNPNTKPIPPTHRPNTPPSSPH